MSRHWVIAILIFGACNTPGTQLDAPVPVPDATLDAPADPADPVALLGAMPPACSVDHWCWRRPMPAGNRFTGVFATAPDNLWLVGENGYVLAWNGTSWRQHVLPSPPFRASMSLGMVTGTSASDIWVLGNDLLYHWDGTQWTLRDHAPPDDPREFNQIWVAPNGDVWVTMEAGTVMRSINGGPFVRTSVPPAQDPPSALGAIWGTAPDDVWISGRPGRMFHWDGSAYTEFATGTHKSGGTMAGANRNDAWIGGYDGTLVHWDGTRWTPVDTGLGATWYIKGIAVVAANDVWWIAQRGAKVGAILHWDGRALTRTTIDTELGMMGLAIVDGRWWIPADSGAVYVKRSTAAPIVAAIEPFHEPIRALWGSSDRDLYAAGPSTLLHHDGTTWTHESVPGVQAIQVIDDISGVALDIATSEVWAVGSSSSTDSPHRLGDVFHRDAGGWTKTQIDATQPLHGVWAMRPGEAMAVGDGGVIYHHASGAWTAIPSPVTTDLFAVWGPDPDHAWIVGAHGTILRWERGAPDLAIETSPIAVDLLAVHGAGGVTWITSSTLDADDMVAVLQSSPTGWIRHPIPYLLAAEGVFARTASDVAIVGSNNGDALFRWNGASFVEERLGHNGSFHGVFRPIDGSEWVVGSNAVLQHVE